MIKDTADEGNQRKQQDSHAQDTQIIEGRQALGFLLIWHVLGKQKGRWFGKGNLQCIVVGNDFFWFPAWFILIIQIEIGMGMGCCKRDFTRSFDTALVQFYLIGIRMFAVGGCFLQGSVCLAMCG